MSDKPRLFGQEFSAGGKTYRVEVLFDDDAMMDGVARFDVNLSFQETGANSWNSLSVFSELDWDKRKLVITAKIDSNDFRHEIDLQQFLSETLTKIKDFADIPDGDYWDGLLDGKLADATEELIHLLPADPLLGCLIKGSLSTVVGQIIRCWPNVRAESQGLDTHLGKLRRKCRALKNCLQTNSFKMFSTFTKRFFKCALFHGFA